MKISNLIRRIRFALSLLPEQSLLPQFHLEGRMHVGLDDVISDLGLAENSCVHFSYQKPEPVTNGV
jgi:hypothetical protein